MVFKKASGFFMGLGLVFLATNASWAAEGSLRLSTLFGDHMVLQREKPTRVWGWAKPGSPVTITVAGKEAVARTGKDEFFVAELPVLDAGGPFTLVASTAAGAVTVDDVMVGDVWVASGQSNMEFQLKAEKHAEKEIPKADLPDIRYFNIEKALSAEPLDDVKGKWAVVSPESAGDCSAIAFYFARRIHRETGVSVGILNNSWGGSAAESWTPLEDLEKDPVLRPIADRWLKKPAEQRRCEVEGWDYDIEFGGMRFVPGGEDGPRDVPLEGWSGSVKPDSTGELTPGKGVPGDGKSLRFAGKMMTGAWGSCAVGFPSAWKLSPDDVLEFKARGHGKFSIGFAQPSITDWDYHGSDGFEAASRWGDYRVPLTSVKQGGWGKGKPFTPGELSGVRLNILVPYMPDEPGVMYNALTAPLGRYGVRGVLWYQGEANAGRAEQYRKLLPALIGAWRRTFGDKDLPFYVVQLAAFMARKDSPSESEWAELREAQARVLEVPNTGMATAVDLGEADDIHPKEKREVGERLARWALRDLYGKDLEVSGPLLKSMTVEGSKALLTFDHVSRGLKAQGGELKGFAVAGEDRVFHWAKARVKKDRVEVTCPEVKVPVAVRYGWADNPECNLVNSEDLPAPPFRTDDWPGLTADRR